MERNWIIFTPMVLSKIFDWIIFGRAMWNSREKIKSAIPREQNYVTWLVKNGKRVFSKLTQKISLSVSGEQASRRANTYSILFLSQIFRYFQACYISGISCTFCLGQMFKGFLTSTFDFYWSLDLEFSCITVRIPQGSFLFSVASD